MKKRTHHLAKIGEFYYLQICIKGERIQRVLLDADGNKITKEADAILARDRLMAAEYGGRRKEALLENLINKLGVETEKQQEAARLAKAAAEAKADLPVADAWKAYLDAPNRPDTGQATLRQYALQFGRFKTWITKRHPDAATVGAVDKSIAVDFMRHLAKEGLSANTRNKYANLLMLVWRTLQKAAESMPKDAAVRPNIATNPWTEDTIARQKLDRKTGRKELTLDQLKAVCESASGELRGLLMLGLYCGLRLGDAARLDWEDVDLTRGAIVTDLHKTGQTVAIPIAEPLRRQLESVSKAERKGPILHGYAAAYRRRPQAIIEQVRKHFQTCGIRTSDKVEGRPRAVARRGFHSLRHSFVTYASASGWPESLVRAIVGHRSDTVTRLYQHQNIELVKHLPALPDVLAGEVELKKLPATAGAAPQIDVDALRKIVSTLKPTNAVEVRARLLEMLEA